MRRDFAITSFAAMLVLGISTAQGVISYETGQNIADGPPYPTDVISFDVFYPPDPVHVIELQMFDAFYPPDPVSPFPLSLLGSDNGISPEGRNPGSIATIAVVSGMSSDVEFPSSTSFDIYIDVLSISGIAGPTSISNPKIVSDAGRFFDLTFEVPINGNSIVGGSVAAVTSEDRRVLHTVRVDLPQEQRNLLIFVTPRIVRNVEGVHLIFDLERTSPTQPDPVLFTMALTGRIIPEPTTAILVMAGCIFAICHRKRC